MKRLFLLVTWINLLHSMDPRGQIVPLDTIDIEKQDRATSITPKHTPPITHKSPTLKEQYVREVCNRTQIDFHPIIIPYIQRELSKSSDSLDDAVEDERRINKIVIKAVSEAFKDRDEEVNKRFTKKKAAYVASGAAIVSSIITGAVALIVAFESQC